MSSRSMFKASMFAANKKAGGSHPTREARALVISMFTSFLYGAAFRLMSIDQIAVKHIVAFMAERKREVALRTVQNNASAIRVMLLSAGRRQFSEDPLISNKALGIAGGSRIGKKKPISASDYEALRARARDPGLRAILALERWFGLRAEEAIRSVRSLNTWRRVLMSGGDTVRIVFGTKGGHRRYTTVRSRANALAAVEEALAVLKSGRKLAPKPNLKSAMTWYQNQMYYLGVQGHSLRYAFICDTVDTCIASGMSKAEGLAEGGLNAGHGDGRGRWVNSVYYQSRDETVARRNEFDCQNVIPAILHKSILLIKCEYVANVHSVCSVTFALNENSGS